jgi:membrane fusion protein, multidrug efflux system
MKPLRNVVVLTSIVLLSVATDAQAPVEVVRVVVKTVDRQVKLPGEFRPYLAVPIYARVPGFVQRVIVDRGSTVRKGQLLATLEAPEMQAQVVEAQSRVQALDLQRVEAAAKLAAAQSTFDRLKAASATPGVVAQNDVVVAEKNVEAAQALVRSHEDLVKAAQAHVQSIQDLEQYLQIRAPFDGVIVERGVHPGALVGPGQPTPLFRLHQLTRLRLVVAVPEALVGGIVKGARVSFTVPAYPGEIFFGDINLIAHDLDEKTRSMPVELDVRNLPLRLGPGMYAEVSWPVRRPVPSLLVPPTSIATTTERTFVVRVRPDGTAEWVNVARGARVGDLIEVHGALKDGDVILRRGTDEVREGATVVAKATS